MNTKLVNVKGTKDQSHMIISTDTEKSTCKVLFLHDKAICKLCMEGMYLETLKGGYDEPIANIMNEGKMKALSERPRTRQGQEQYKNETFSLVFISR